MLKQLFVTAAVTAAVSVPLAGAASADPLPDSGSNVNSTSAGGGDVSPPGGLSTLPPGIRIVERHLASLGDDDEMSAVEQMRMQNLMERRGKLSGTLSNMLKRASGTAVTITQNIK